MLSDIEEGDADRESFCAIVVFTSPVCNCKEISARVERKVLERD